MGGTPGFDPAAMQAAKEAKAAEAAKAIEDAKDAEATTASDDAAATDTTADAPVVPTVEPKAETAAEKKARELAEKKAQEAAEKEAKKIADEEAKAAESKKIYFVNRKTSNLSTLVGNFLEGVLVVETAEHAEIVRKTEDFQRGFIDELSEKEYKASKEAK